MLSDFNFHALGVPDNATVPVDTDDGKDHLYQFRTPTLRNATLTGVDEFGQSKERVDDKERPPQQKLRRSFFMRMGFYSN